jgi:hypothetical protein
VDAVDERYMFDWIWSRWVDGFRVGWAGGRAADNPPVHAGQVTTEELVRTELANDLSVASMSSRAAIRDAGAPQAGRPDRVGESAAMRTGLHILIIIVLILPVKGPFEKHESPLVATCSTVIRCIDRAVQATKRPTRRTSVAENLALPSSDKAAQPGSVRVPPLIGRNR